MKISGYILGLLLFTTIPAHAGYESARTNGLIAASVILVYFGGRLLTRGSYSKLDKIFEVVGGCALIAAGFAGIVLSGEISHEIEKLYHK